MDGEIIGVTDYLAQKPIYYREDIEILASEIDVLRGFGPVTPNKLFLSNVGYLKICVSLAFCGMFFA